MIGIPASFLPLTACNESSQKLKFGSSSSRTKRKEIRSSAYLKRTQSDKFLPKKPKYRHPIIPPMPLEERIKRNIVPYRGFCSLVPGGDALISGNGAISIEIPGNPYTEQISLSHESLFAPRKSHWRRQKLLMYFQRCDK